MPASTGLNYLDIFLLAVMVILSVRGALHGFLAEIAGVVGLVGGVVLAGHWYQPLGERLGGLLGKSDWVYAVAFVLVLFGFILAVGLTARVLGKILSIGCAEAINHVGGGVAGLLKGFAVSCAVAYFACLLVPQSDMVRGSQLLPLIRDAMNVVGADMPRTGVWRYLPNVPNLKVPASLPKRS